ncbi:hypothetical protein [Spirosoma aerolatum]|nr:hypothetical protein [Spirosoma aerolatum]
MKTHPKNKSVVSSKKTYASPKLKVLGSVRTLTLKSGSNTDGFGGTFV